MSSDFSHVDPDVQALLFDSDGDRIRFIDRSGFVPWPQATEALQAILHRGEGDPPSEPTFVMIHGGPRTGKSDILEEADRQLRTAYPLERRCLRIIAPSAPLESRLIHMVQAAGEVPTTAGRDLMTQRGRAIDGLRRDGARVLLADNLHDAAPTARMAKGFLPIWRNFCDEAHVDGCFSTTQHAKDWLAADPQLAARTQVFTLAKWPAHRWVADVVGAALRRYPLRLPTRITGEFMDVLYGATGGMAGRVFAKLKLAAKMAIYSRDEAITPDLLRKAVEGRSRI